MKKLINCIVFNINVDLDVVSRTIYNIGSIYPLLFLTPHALFDYEYKKLFNFIKTEIIINSFSDYISEKEAIICDENAYQICNDNKSADINHYYYLIKKFKNKTIIDNIQKRYIIHSGIILSKDLGIDIEEWTNIGFTNPNQTILPQKRILLKPCRKFYCNLIEKYHQITNENNINSIYIIKYKGENFLFLGKVSRLQQYLKKGIMIYKIKIPFSLKIYNFFSTKNNVIEEKQITRVIKKYKINKSFSSIHEHRAYFKDLTQRVGINYGVLQDGYIPGNYGPFYKLYLAGIQSYVWDNISIDMFVNNEMPVKTLPLYESTNLPYIEHIPKEIKTVLILTSAAGDWTAVKNRSDDDLMLMAFVEVAQHFKDINFIYRCHPLWVHPTHQGERSIERAHEYLVSTGLKNIKISEGSFTHSSRYMRDGHLFVDPKSVTEEIMHSDLVFGEHSYSMIEAAKKGKIFASVLIANRRDYFINYSKLGFFHLNSVESILEFIKTIKCQPIHIMDKYNLAVKKHNDLLLETTKV